MLSEETEFFNILGVGKNGTTLLGSLIDNHPQISTISIIGGTLARASWKRIFKALHDHPSKHFVQLWDSRVMDDEDWDVIRVYTGYHNEIEDKDDPDLYLERYVNGHGKWTGILKDEWDSMDDVVDI